MTPEEHCRLGSTTLDPVARSGARSAHGFPASWNSDRPPGVTLRLTSDPIFPPGEHRVRAQAADCIRRSRHLASLNPLGVTPRRQVSSRTDPTRCGGFAP